jgi:hypothetical protein
LKPGALVLCPNCGEPLGLQLSGPGAAKSSSAKEDLFSHLVIDDKPPASGAYGDDTAPNPIISPIATDSQFPKEFPKRPPDLEGTVILVESHEEPKRSNGVSEAIFNGLLDILWSIPGTIGSQNQSKEKEKVQVTRVRIRTPDERQRDIRIEGRLTGVNVAQGDRVSLWGKHKHGLLAFQHGYNHTAEGSIRTSKMASPKSGLLLIVVALTGILALLYYYSGHHTFP